MDKLTLRHSTVGTGEAPFLSGLHGRTFLPDLNLLLPLEQIDKYESCCRASKA